MLHLSYEFWDFAVSYLQQLLLLKLPGISIGM